MFKEKSNPGLIALYRVAYENYKPYEDIYRSTNTKEFTRDIIDIVIKQEFVRDTTLDSK